MKKKTLLSSILVIVLCISIIAGSTFALFTTEDKVNVAVNSANVDVTANLIDGSLKTWSLYEDYKDDTVAHNGDFFNGGFAQIVDEANVQIDLMTPGDLVKFTIDVKNNSNVDVNYRVRMLSNTFGDANDLTPALVVAAFIDHDADPSTPNKRFDIGGDDAANATLWQFVEQNAEIKDIYVYVAFPNTDESISPDNADNKYQNCSASLTFTIEAVQANGKVYDHAAANVDDLASSVEKGGIVTANGQTIAVDEMTYANNKSVKVIDATLDGSAMNGLGGIVTNEYGDITIGMNSTLIASAAPETSAVFTLNYLNSEQTLTFDKDSKVIVPAGGVAIRSMGSSSVVNTYLGSADIFELANGAYFIYPMGNGTMNIYVPTELVYDAYMAMDLPVNEGDGCAWSINWFVEGDTAPRATYDKTVHAFVEVN